MSNKECYKVKEDGRMRKLKNKKVRYRESKKDIKLSTFDTMFRDEARIRLNYMCLRRVKNKPACTHISWIT